MRATVATATAGAVRTTPRGASLEAALGEIERRFGGVVRRGGVPLAAGVWPTGVPVLDELTGIGGLPLGRVCLLAGASRGATGRLTLLQALAARASREMTVAYLDVGGTLDPGFLADLGADLDSCIVVRPPDGRAATGLAMLRALVRGGVPWVVAALTRGRVPGGLDHALSALVGEVEAHRAVAVIAAAPPPAALAYASSLTLGCSAAGWQEVHGDIAGLRLRVCVVRSKLGAPGAQAGLLLRYPRPWAAAEIVGLPEVVSAGGRREPERVPAAADAGAPPALAGAAGAG